MIKENMGLLNKFDFVDKYIKIKDSVRDLDIYMLVHRYLNIFDETISYQGFGFELEPLRNSVHFAINSLYHYKFKLVDVENNKINIEEITEKEFKKALGKLNNKYNKKLSKFL